MSKQFRTVLFGLGIPCASFLSAAQSSASSGKPIHPGVRVWQDAIELPTYQEGLPDENPPFDQFVTNGRYNYPYTMRATSATVSRLGDGGR